MIPKVIHFVFFGFTEFEYIHYLAVKSALRIHQGWTIKIHCAKVPQGNPLWDEVAKDVQLVYCEPPDQFRGIKLTSYQYKADISRLEILIREGGVYLDIDVISLRSLDTFLYHRCVLGVELAQDPNTVDLQLVDSITNAVMLCEPNHPFIIDMLDKTADNLNNQAWAHHAVKMPLEMLRAKTYDVHIEPSKSFMPFEHRDYSLFESDLTKMSRVADSYTMHMWDTIWRHPIKNVLAQVNDRYLAESGTLLAAICKQYRRDYSMPSSSESGKRWTADILQQIVERVDSVSNVLDIGVGMGTYWDRYNKLVPGNWTGVEVWSNYIEQYQLRSKYNSILQQDARMVDYATLPRQDIAIAGDVLEHMTKQEATDLVDKLLTHSRCLIVSIPVSYSPQGEWGGNPYEVHVKDDWSDGEVKETFGQNIVDSNVENDIGVYLLSRDQSFIKQLKKLKIAIYTICKNEEKLIDRWARTNAQADYRLVCDTGSTDCTVDKLKQHGVNTFSISVSPWRFDVARNTALNLLPEDIDVCIWQDFDEELMPGWYEQIQQHWKPGTTVANHRYRNNDNPWQWHSKIHARHNCRWTGAVHETLVWTVPDSTIWISDLYLDEHQDTTKDRKGYLQLLEKKIAEGDNNWRTYAFLAGEYQSQGMMDKCLEARHKSYDLCDEGEVIKSYAARHTAIVYSYMQNNAQAECWFKKATEHGNEREAWFKLAEFYFSSNRWEECYLAVRRCLFINDRRDGFTQDHAAWGYLPYDYAALSAYHIGLYNQAAMYGKQALAHHPDDARLKSNVAFYEESSDVPLPPVLEIETSSACNRTCGACLRNSHPDREKVDSWFQDKLMPMETIQLIFEQAKNMGFKEALGLSHYNEPLTDPRIVDILKMAKTYPFARIFFHSNGDLLTPELAAEIDGLPDWITFSIYADSPAKEKRQAQIASWFSKTQVRFTSGELGLTHFGPVDNLSGIIESVKHLPCSEPRDRFIINHKGEMEFCCDDLGGNFNLGSVSADNTLHDLWFNPRFQRMVKQLSHEGGRKGLAYCETCPRPHSQNIKAKNIKVVRHEAS